MNPNEQRDYEPPKRPLGYCAECGFCKWEHAEYHGPWCKQVQHALGTIPGEGHPGQANKHGQE